MKKDTKTALLDAAETAIRRRGYDGFSYADLADAVGIRTASIHYHFPTKAKLAATLMHRYHDDVLAHCAKITLQGGTCADKLRGLITFYRDAAGGGEKLCLCVSLSTTPDSLDTETTLATTTFRQAIIAWLEPVFEQGLTDGSLRAPADPKDEAPALLAQLEGAQLAARSARDISLYDRALRLFSARLG